MPNIIVCYKWVKDEADIWINPDLSVDFSRAKGKISEYDRNAIETGMQCADNDDQIVSLTYGSDDAKKSLKDALSRGPQKGYWVNDPDQNTADGAKTGQILAAAIKKIGDTKLVICAEGASDTYSHETGSRIGALLDIPVITNVVSLILDGDKVQATRKLKNSLQTVEAKLPAVITVLPEIYPAPIPGLKMVMGASRKPTEMFSIDDLGLSPEQLAPKTTLKNLSGFADERKNVLINEGTAEEKAQKLVQNLTKEGVL